MLFDRWVDNTRRELWLMQADGTAGSGSWPTRRTVQRRSPAGDRLLFWQGALAGLWTMRPDGTEASLLEPLHDAGVGEWSPDGSEIVAEFAGGAVRRVPLDGGDIITLSVDGADELGRWLR